MEKKKQTLYIVFLSSLSVDDMQNAFEKPKNTQIYIFNALISFVAFPWINSFALPMVCFPRSFH